MTKPANAAYLPVAIVFGIACLGFVAMGNPIWVAFLPLAITFLALSRSADDDEDDVDDEPPSDDADPSERASTLDAEAEDDSGRLG